MNPTAKVPTATLLAASVILTHLPPRNCPKCGHPVTFTAPRHPELREIPGVICTANRCQWTVIVKGSKEHQPITDARHAATVAADAGDWPAFDAAMASYHTLLADAAVTPWVAPTEEPK